MNLSSNPEKLMVGTDHRLPVSQEILNSMPETNPNRHKNISLAVKINLILLNIREIADRIKKR